MAVAREAGRSRRVRYRLAGAATVVLAALVGLVGLAPAAFAHHSEITGAADCAQVVTWQASAWQTNDVARRVNNHVKVWYVVDDGPDAGAQATVMADGHFGADDGYTFGGTFAWPDAAASSVTLWVQEQVGWGVNQDLAGISDPRSATVRPATGCPVPGTPAVHVAEQCVDGDGTLVLTLANTAGNQAIEFVVTDPRDGSTSGRTVPPGGQAAVTLAGLTDGSYSVPVSADGHPLAPVAVDVRCDSPGRPSVGVAPACTAEGGQITVALSNEGLPGKARAVVFVVADPTGTGPDQTVTVEPGETGIVRFGGVPDGRVSVAVTADGEPVETVTVEVACHQPVVPPTTVPATPTTASPTTASPTTASPTSITASPTPTPPSTATVLGVQVARSELPRTGAPNTFLLVAVAGLLIVAGGCFVMAARTEA